MPSTPLRLITNNGTIRLVIKKRLSDCSMVASKLIVILDDILWVLTRSQLLKLSSFVHYMVKLRSKFLPLTRESAPSSTQPTHTPPQTASQDQLFSAYDLTETSFHLHNQRIDLHLCDDSTLQGNLQNQNDSQNTHDGAALQISVMAISVDHCPYHLASTKRSVVKSDEEVMFQRMRWAHELLNNFQETEGKSVRPRKSLKTYGNLVGYSRFHHDLDLPSNQYYFRRSCNFYFWVLYLVKIKSLWYWLYLGIVYALKNIFIEKISRFSQLIRAIKFVENS